MNYLTEKWRKLLAESDTAGFFQTPECFSFFQNLSFLRPVLVYVEDNEKLKGLICGYIIHEGKGIKKWMTKRAIVPGGALLHPEITENELIILLNKLTTELRKQHVIYIEIRNYNDYSNYKDCFKRAGFQYVPHLNFRVFTPDFEVIYSQLNTNKRKDLKQSKIKGVHCNLTKDKKDIAQLYYLLLDLYQKKIKTPLFPLDFFLRLNEQEFSRFFIVKLNQNVIGGSVCVVFNGQVIYEWFVCGLDAHFRHCYPSTVATWAPIEYAATHGYQYFDMMGAGKPNDDYGVRNFKSKFGGQSVEHGRFMHILRPQSFHFGKLVVEYLRKSGKKIDK